MAEVPNENSVNQALVAAFVKRRRGQSTETPQGFRVLGERNASPTFSTLNSSAVPKNSVVEVIHPPGKGTTFTSSVADDGQRSDPEVGTRATIKEDEEQRESEIRKRTIPGIKEFVKRQEAIIGSTPEEKVTWLLDAQPQEFDQLLIGLNGTIRGIAGNHTFDGDSVYAGERMSGYAIQFPPDQQDKEIILHYALSEVQEKGKQMLASGISSQEILNFAAVVLPVTANKAHLFDEGNGRSTRTARMLIRDGAKNAESRVDAIVLKDEFNRYDTSPISQIDYVITGELEEQYAVTTFRIVNDVVDDYEIDEILIDEINSLPNIDPKIARCSQDSFNFDLAIKVYVKNQDDKTAREESSEISLRGLLEEVSSDREKGAEFLDTFRQVRRDRSILWVDSLTGKREIHLRHHQRWLEIINWGRKDKGLPELTDEDVNTAEKLQAAYVESRSPIAA